MATPTTVSSSEGSSGHDSHDDHHEHHGNFITNYIFSTDHKTIGIQYGLMSLAFLFLGFLLILVMRWQLAYPDEALPLGLADLLRPILGEAMIKANGAISADLYNSFGAMHGTIMVFLAIVPVAFGAFGNYVVPLQIGAPDMTFPKINMASFWVFAVGGIIMVFSFFVPGGAAKSGWTSYSPLANVADSNIGKATDEEIPAIISERDGISVDAVTPGMVSQYKADSGYVLPVFNGQTLWILGMVFLITSSLLGSVNFITTIIHLRAEGLGWMQLPFFCWAQLVTAFLLLLAFPPLEAAGFMQLMDRVAGTSFFLPSGLYVGGDQLAISGGGSPLLWQHLFWFLAHPEVYVLILPAIGIVAEVVACNTRKPLWGYKLMVYSIWALAFLSFIVWAHHMYLTNMGAWISAFFQTTTIAISVPSVILLTCLIMTFWGGSIRFPTAMLFATAFIPMFGFGGLTGIPLAFSAIDLYLHDTYYVIGHFHYIVAPGTIFAVFAGLYHWYPKVTGRMMSEFWGKVHFWPSLICMNGIFLPMFLQGMAGMHRRWYDGGQSYDLAAEQLIWNPVMTWSAIILGIFQVPFILNFFLSLKLGAKAPDNPWGATTLEWQTPTPPGHGNFEGVPVVPEGRGPYEYSVEGAGEDGFLPQGTVDKTRHH